MLFFYKTETHIYIYTYKDNYTHTTIHIYTHTPQSTQSTQSTQSIQIHPIHRIHKIDVLDATELEVDIKPEIIKFGTRNSNKFLLVVFLNHDQTQQ